MIKFNEFYLSLNEKFEQRKMDIGTVKLSTSDMSDKHIQDILSKISKQTGIPKKQLEATVNKNKDAFKTIHDKSPLLYNTMMANTIETETFRLIGTHNVTVKTAPVFSNEIFISLWNIIRVEHKEFFPLKDFIHKTTHHNPKYLIVPNKFDTKFNEVKTAAATPKGEFIFNRDFCQQLLTYANLKGITPKGRKYVSNGGNIPDEYAYVEFLILHELMHYTYADFHYHKIIKDSESDIINWVGDLRTNYLLVKSGYEQIPDGLFNDLINFDRQKSYQEMYDIVKKELEKLNDTEKKQVSQQLGSMGDDHSKGEGQGEGEPTSATIQDIEDMNKKIESEFSERSKDLTDEEAKQEAQSQDSSKNGQSASPRKDTSPSNIDYTKVVPKYKWDVLLKKLLTSLSNNSEETYSRPSRRNVTGLSNLDQFGKSVVKPGEVISSLNTAKIVFCIDSSGSMSSEIEKVYSNINNLFITYKNLAKLDFYVIKFSNDYHIYKCNFAKNTFTDVKGEEQNGNVKSLFTKHYGAGTAFSKQLVDELVKFANDKYNILLFSDSDLLDGANANNVRTLYKSINSLFVFADNKSTYEDYMKKFNMNKYNVTYITES